MQLRPFEEEVSANIHRGSPSKIERGDSVEEVKVVKITEIQIILLSSVQEREAGE